MVHAGLLDETSETTPVPTRVGSLDHYPGVRSRFLSHAHDVIVCVPPEYELEPQRRFPVLYLHDGQNVFDDLPMSPVRCAMGRGHDVARPDACRV